MRHLTAALLLSSVASLLAQTDSATPPPAGVVRALAYADNSYVAVDGRYWVVSQPRHHAVLLYQSTETVPHLLHAFGTHGRMAGQLVRPTGVAISTRLGLIYVSDSENDRVQAFQFDPANPGRPPFFVKALGRRGRGPGELDRPAGLAVDADGILYVSDAGNSRAQVFSSELRFVRAWGTLGAAPGQFDMPLSIALDPQGAWVYVADPTNLRIQAFDRTGTFLFAWGRTASAAPTPEVLGAFAYPFGLAVGGDGHVYVTDCRRKVVEKFMRDGGFVQEWGGPGQAVGRFFQPAGVAVDDRGRIIVIDFGGSRAQMFTADGRLLYHFTIPAGDLAPKPTPQPNPEN